MDHQFSKLADRPESMDGNSVTARLLSPFITAFIVLILGLIGLTLT